MSKEFFYNYHHLISFLRIKSMIANLITSACTLASECPDKSTECIQWIYANADWSNIWNWSYTNTAYKIESDTPMDEFKWVYADWAYWTSRTFDFDCSAVRNMPSWAEIASLVVLGVLLAIALASVVVVCMGKCRFRGAEEKEASEYSLRII